MSHHSQFQDLVIKKAWYWYKNRYVHQWNQTEDPDISLHTYGHIFVIKKPEIHTGEKKDNAFNKWCSTN